MLSVQQNVFALPPKLTISHLSRKNPQNTSQILFGGGVMIIMLNTTMSRKECQKCDGMLWIRKHKNISTPFGSEYDFVSICSSLCSDVCVPRELEPLEPEQQQT